MKIPIISDIHDNLVNLEKCLNWCDKEKIKNLICCGDLTNGETLKFLAENFSGDIYLVRGNIEIYKEEEVEKYKNIKYLGRIGKIDLAGKQIGICHEPYLVDKVLEKGDCDIIFYGHTHQPFEDKRGNTKIINPGTLGGVFTKATFAVYDILSGETELEILELL